MKAVSVVSIRKELKHKSDAELAELCLRLSRFKKENKELLTYLLFEADDEQAYIETVKNEIDEQFEAINTNSFFYIKKSVRKILRNTKKYIRYSLNKETEVELLLYFCKKLKAMSPSIKRNTTLLNLFDRNMEAITKKILKLHEDLQHDYGLLVEELER
ncbi:hypothetical protein ESY86_01675 [Subsaximicrobium wynnwilliamsii]|jgi:hypothetical protein|uniref:Uncharacterized protein n=1 Tax=Subsaximicrobium wynnwilliamsii TaxID=291179 RepID=A0A5C6ZN99_9FLAO|nr:hypothetical protein [Subsaximicrobium wynnwilliamsii]TXD85277.1 hypothetical protein ESY87_02845 [Subsaximicrobium wynnwilliamsii]TXD91319.1 hypothetical protein ESY86_01675 [Subsaximicrobium wynnwilliamsii]TXE04713.1 hypothetical protein ESY88_04325 [Subsaximicrobium wynnwilliamsii]